MTSPTTVDVFAPACVTLALHAFAGQVTGKILAFTDKGDRARIIPAKGVSLELTGDMADTVSLDETNAVRASVNAFGDGPGARIVIEKSVPSGAGLGAQAVLAAATMRGISRSLRVPISEDGSSSDPDVRAAMVSRACLWEAPECKVREIPLPQLNAVIVDAGLEEPASTGLSVPHRDDAETFGELPELCDAIGFSAWLIQQPNDLEEAVRAIVPPLDEVLDELALAPGCLLARVSGASAICFALFPDRATAIGAASMLASLHPVWWVEAVSLS
ncbi:MAG: hypothetical protein AAGF13_05830 [Pseudomonadota bacterium]